MVGIYKITSPSNRVYIGQSVNIEKRLNRYKRMSVKTKGQTKVWRSLVKYGAENHKYEVIEECDICLLNKRERYWQEFYDCVDNGLNCNYTKTSDKSGKVSKETLKRMSKAQKGNSNWLGRNHTEESKEKIRKKAIGRKFSKEVNLSKGRKGRVSNNKGKFGIDAPKSKKIAQYSKSGELIKVWDCGLDIKRELGFSNSNISSCCNGKLNTSSGYIWRFV
jgi:group I intron endonuclease